VTNSKNSFELIAFLWKCYEYTRCIFVNLRLVALSSEEFGSFLAFFYWMFGLFWKNKSGNPGDQLELGTA